MFGFEFLFASALWALPLVGLPVLLHLLFRRKAPVVMFSTLRFVKASMQRTAARKRVQRWLLLACRALLLLLLIWAVAQPARRLAESWFGANSLSAAIVVDTSYSMQLAEHQVKLLSKANDAVEDLLRGPLREARVVVYRSLPAAAAAAENAQGAEQFQSAASLISQWTPLQPQPAPVPLSDRIAAAAAQLAKESADHKWLIVLTDLQRREFPQPLPAFADGRTILIDLHPRDGRSAGITRVAAEPPQPRPGIASQAVIDVAGRAGESRAVDLQVTSVDHPEFPPIGPPLPMATLDTAGRTTLRTPVKLEGGSWLLLKASLQAADDMPWDDARTTLVHLAPPAPTAILPVPHPDRQAEAILRIALDPSQGTRDAWPISLRPSGALKGDESLIAAALTEWPDAPTARRLADFVARGGTLVWFLRPGLEETWPALPGSVRQALGPLLPSPPSRSRDSGPFRASVARPDDPLLTDAGDVTSAAGRLRIDRLVPFEPTDDPSVTRIVAAATDDPAVGSGRLLHGLLYRRTLGTGQVYTWATFPTPLYGNLATYELFLPMLVNASLRPASAGRALNVELGQRIELPADPSRPSTPLDLVPPQGPPIQVAPTDDAQGKRYVSEPVAQPGLYAWRGADGTTVAWTNVQLPAAESQLDYRPAAEVAVEGPNVIVARSLDDLAQKMARLEEPEAHWSGPIALVCFLLCLEALMGSVSKLWKPSLPRFFVPKVEAMKVG